MHASIDFMISLFQMIEKSLILKEHAKTLIYGGDLKEYKRLIMIYSRIKSFNSRLKICIQKNNIRFMLENIKSLKRPLGLSLKLHQ